MVDLLNNELKFNALGFSAPFQKDHEINDESLLTSSGLETPNLSNNPSLSQEDKVKEFMAMSNQDYDKAKATLVKYNWDLELASQSIFSSQLYN